MSEITFQSNIKFIDKKSFNQKTKNLNPKRHKVDYPWIEDVSKTGKKIFTDKIMDCICVSIIDKNKATMFHLCTRNQEAAKRTRQKGFNIKNIERRILEKLANFSEEAHAFILGAWDIDRKHKLNYYKLSKVIDIFKKNDVPHTILAARKGNLHLYGRYSVFYEGKTDTIYLTNTLTNSPSPAHNDRYQVEIKEDGISYIDHTDEGKGTIVDCGVEDYFKSQFSLVKIAKCDKFFSD